MKYVILIVPFLIFVGIFFAVLNQDKVEPIVVGGETIGYYRSQESKIRPFSTSVAYNARDEVIKAHLKEAILAGRLPSIEIPVTANTDLRRYYNLQLELLEDLGGSLEEASRGNKSVYELIREKAQGRGETVQPVEYVSKRRLEVNFTNRE